MADGSLNEVRNTTYFDLRNQSLVSGATRQPRIASAILVCPIIGC